MSEKGKFPVLIPETGFFGSLYTGAHVETDAIGNIHCGSRFHNTMSDKRGLQVRRLHSNGIFFAK